MNRYPVNDRNIISIGYDEINNTLEIEFKLQAIHQYFNVSLDQFIALMKAPEIETYFFNFIYSQYYFDVF